MEIISKSVRAGYSFSFRFHLVTAESTPTLCIVIHTSLSRYVLSELGWLDAFVIAFLWIVAFIHLFDCIFWKLDGLRCHLQYTFSSK